MAFSACRFRFPFSGDTRRPVFAAIVLLLATLGALATPPARAWSETGHRVIATLASMQLRPATRDRVESLLAVIDAGPTMADGAVWMDVIRANDLLSFDRWHYINIPYTVEDQPPFPAKDENVIWAIDRARTKLADPNLTEGRQAFYVAVLLHTVGDIHQPMHCVGRISRAFPEGDRGGNDFPVAIPFRNLHQLWDRTANLLPHITANDHDAFHAHAMQLAKAHPRADLPEVDVLDPTIWADESYQLAVHVAYQGIEPNASPSEAYMRRAQATVGRRLVLAAHRLATLLEETVGATAP